MHVLPTNDPLDVVGLVSPCGPNADVSPEAVLRFVADLSRECAFRLRGVARDGVQIVLLGAPADPVGLLRRIESLRPDESNDVDTLTRLRRIVLWGD